MKTGTARKITYIDPHLQGRHWLGLIALELLVIGGALVYLYIGLQQTLENSLYSVHSLNRQSLLSAFFVLLGRVALITVSANLLLLALGHYIWVRRVRALMQQFRHQLDQLSRLNFKTPQPAPRYAKDSHEFSYLLWRWSNRERHRFGNLIRLINQLPDPVALHPEQQLSLQNHLKRAVYEFLHFDHRQRPRLTGSD